MILEDVAQRMFGVQSPDYGIGILAVMTKRLLASHPSLDAHPCL